MLGFIHSLNNLLFGIEMVPVFLFIPFFGLIPFIVPIAYTVYRRRILLASGAQNSKGFSRIIRHSISLSISCVIASLILGRIFLPHSNDIGALFEGIMFGANLGTILVLSYLVGLSYFSKGLFYRLPKRYSLILGIFISLFFPLIFILQYSVGFLEKSTTVQFSNLQTFAPGYDSPFKISDPDIIQKLRKIDYIHPKNSIQEVEEGKPFTYKGKTYGFRSFYENTENLVNNLLRNETVNVDNKLFEFDYDISSQKLSQDDLFHKSGKVFFQYTSSPTGVGLPRLISKIDGKIFFYAGNYRTGASSYFVIDLDDKKAFGFSSDLPDQKLLPVLDISGDYLYALEDINKTKESGKKSSEDHRVFRYNYKNFDVLNPSAKPEDSYFFEPVSKYCNIYNFFIEHEKIYWLEAPNKYEFSPTKCFAYSRSLSDSELFSHPSSELKSLTTQ